MRALAVLALAACGASTDVVPPCRPPASLDTVAPGNIISGAGTAGVTWTVLKPDAEEVHGAIVSADGTIGPDIQLDDVDTHGVIGNTTALWPRETGLVLQRGGIVTDITTLPRTSTFDGTRYQLFWGNPVQHQTLDEDGTLGPVHALGLDSSGFAVVSDRAGTTFIRVSVFGAPTRGYILDTATGELRLVLEGATGPYEPPFFFAGEVHHNRNNDELIGINPSMLTAPTIRDIEIYDAERFLPTASRLYILSVQSMMALDTSFTYLGRMPGVYSKMFSIGTIENDTVQFTEVAADVTSRTPGRLELVRMSMTGEVWRSTVAVDSPIVDDKFCAERE
jgi:hypothetical protein